MTETFQQAELIEEATGARLMCWLPMPDRRIKPGTELTLKGMRGRIWRVIHVYHGCVDRTMLKTDWKVGGLL